MVSPSTHEPDADNADVGIFNFYTGIFHNQGPRIFFGDKLMIKINGENYELENCSIDDCLKHLEINEKFVVVELNGEIIPKDQYKSTTLMSNDSLEIVSFVGGG